MARKLIEYKISDIDAVAYSGYNSTKTILGPMIYQYTASSTNDYYISPPNLTFDNISQNTGLNGFGPVSVINYNDTYDWVFMVQNPSGSLRIVGYEFNKKTSSYRYLGMINSPTHNGTNTNWADIATSLDYYSAGTVQVIGNLVSGTSTNWGDNYINSGCRIGFGSTDPNQITNWYTITNTPLETNRFNGLTWATEVDSLGRIYVGGPFTSTFTTYSYFGTAFTATRLIRLNSDGSPDTTFNTGTGISSNIRRIKVDPTNSSRVYVAGDFGVYNGVTVNYLVRINVSDGSIDTSFSGGTRFNNLVYDIDIDSSGKIYATGVFTTYNGVSAVRLCRLNTDGTLDTSFSGISTGLVYNPSAGSSAGYCCAVEPVTDKIYVGGLFDRWGGTVFNTNYTGAFPVMRLNTNGTIDFTYSAGTYYNNFPFTIQPDNVNGGVYIGGSFTAYSGVTNNYIIKTTTGGTKDNSFDNSTGFNGAVQKIRLTSSGKLYVGSAFTTYKGVSAIYVIKLNSNGTTDTSFTPFTNTAGTQWNQGNINLSDTIAINSTNESVYVTQAATTVAFGGLIAYTSAGTINNDFYSINTQRLTISGSSLNLSAGTPYVIEDLRFAVSRTVGANAYGGLYTVKGIKITDFISGTTTLNALTNGFYGLNARTSYWLPDGVNSTTLTSLYGIALDNNSGYTSQYIYTMNYNNLTLYVFDVRKLYWMTSTSTIAYPNTYVFASSLGFDSGLVSYNNPVITTTQSGTAAGVKSLYYPRQSSIRQIPMSSILSGVNPTTYAPFQTMNEIPPGNTTTYPATNAFIRLDYVPEIDRFVIGTNGTSTKSYITSFNSTLNAPTLVGTVWSRDSYNTLSYQNSFERAFLVNNQQLQGPLSNANAPKYPDTQGTTLPFIRSNNGWLHYVRGVSSTENMVYAIPVAADEQYVSTSNNVIITPKYIIPNLISITGFYLNTLKEIGASVFSQSPEPIFTDFRTTGIDDNSGSWTNFNSIDDLNGLLCNNTTNSVTIQFRFRFRVAGLNCYPNRLYGFSFTYEDDTTDSHYVSSIAKSNLNTRIFAWQQVELFGGTIPDLRVRVYNANTGDIILYDTVTDSNLGTWQYSTDGTNWNSWSSSADTIGNYVRYTADYLPSNYKLRVGLNTI